MAKRLTIPKTLAEAELWLWHAYFHLNDQNTSGVSTEAMRGIRQKIREIQAEHDQTFSFGGL